MDIDRFLYWFLTREPEMKLAMVAATSVAILLGCILLVVVLNSLI
jgi:cell division protein FtsX